MVERFWATREQELEADCWAARALAQTGHLGDLERVYIDFSYEGRIPPGNYPSGSERARHVARCTAESVGRDDRDDLAIASRRRAPCQHRVACVHQIACVHQVPCEHREACIHAQSCQHLSSCVHRIECSHRIPCGHVQFTQFGPRPVHPYDTLHPFDTAHAADAQHSYDAAHPYDAAHFFDTEHPFDTEHEYDTEHEFDYEP